VNPNPKFRLQGLMLASLMFIADQIVKYAMLGPLQLKERGVIHIISFFDLRYAENRGVSMSFLTADSDGERWALVALTAVIAAGVAVWMWRVMLCLLGLNEETFARTFDSFRERPADILLEYDASLRGLGLFLTDLRTNKRIGVGAMSFPFNLGEESRWQNTAEFVAVVMGVVWCLW
jgi:hypothetical protein